MAIQNPPTLTRAARTPPLNLPQLPYFLLALISNLSPTMADRQPGQGPLTRQSRPGSETLLGRLHELGLSSSQVVGFLSLVISSAILLVLTGLTVTAALTGLVFFAPIIIVSSPVWVPAAAFLFVGVTGFLSACGVGVALLAGATWMYRYFTGRHPVGSGGVDYARSRIADTAREVKDYARDHGIYFSGRVKDAAPGA